MELDDWFERVEDSCDPIGDGVVKDGSVNHDGFERHVGITKHRSKGLIKECLEGKLCCHWHGEICSFGATACFDSIKFCAVLEFKQVPDGNKCEWRITGSGAASQLCSSNHDHNRYESVFVTVVQLAEQNEGIVGTAVPCLIRLRLLDQCSLIRIGDISEQGTGSANGLALEASGCSENWKGNVVDRCCGGAQGQLKDEVIECGSQQMSDTADPNTPRGVRRLDDPRLVDFISCLRITITNDAVNIRVLDESRHVGIQSLGFILSHSDFESGAIQYAHVVHSCDEQTRDPKNCEGP